MIDLNQYMQGSSPYDNAIGVRYEDGDYSLETTFPSMAYSESDKQHTIKEGETLQNIAYCYYKDSGKWYIIASANNIMNPFKDLVPGQIIRIPSYGS